MRKNKSRVAGRRGGGMRKAAIEKAKAKKQSGGRYIQVPEGIKFLKIDKAGYRRLDIIPYRVSVKNNEDADVGDLWYQKNFSIHRDIGVDNDSYVCPQSVRKGRCPICEAYADAKQNRDEETAKALKPSERTLFNIIDTESDDDSIYIWDYSFYLFEKYLNEELDALEEDEDNDPDWFFGNLVGGSTLKIRFSEESFNKNKYYKTGKIDFIDRDDYPESILDRVVDLDKCLCVLPYDKLKNVFMGLDFEEDDDEDGDSESEEMRTSRGSRGRSHGSKRRSSSTEEDTDDDVPRRRTGRRGRVEEKTEEEEECPYGFEYGADYDKKDACANCDLWRECCAANEAATKER